MEEEISLSELFATLKKRLSMIISLGLIGLIVAAGFTFFIATPQYNATTQILVNRTTESAEGMQLTDINTNVQMINTYKDIIKGPVILNEVRENLGTNLTTTDLSEKIEITTEENSQVFSLSVSDDNPYEAANIANSVAGTFQNEIGNIMNVENVTIISNAVPNTNQISPNNLLNLVFGVLIGSILGICVAFLLEFMDKSVRDEQFITETLGWSVLGSVSEMTVDELEAKIETKKPELNSRRTKSRI
ncbi:YveK family protein [Carnobacterium inhibens]|uniref:Capsular polysaccharide biosynthesis protein CpsC n=1 Tax=Carnobacterium inhibens TaxID=147709 RepID=A0ABR7TEM4_9LACT|nr:Wzz/FepE/Etk N-terminal domain-containing protein [Carnobacterium inhibens]MBC9825910.1 chain-length determining protein [Carnobacterium inhibens]